MQNIRNFCILAHIDHGKSTLADRFLELTGTVPKNKMRPQYLDMMDLERERGITIKMQPVRMLYHPDRGKNADISQKIADSKLIYEDLTYKIRGILFKVRKNLGLGHKEGVYHNALEIEFKTVGLAFESKKNIPITHEGSKVGTYQPDFIIENEVLLELKALPEIGRPQIEQLWSYLKGSEYNLALLANFGSKELEIRRVVYDTARPRVIPRDSALSPRGSAGVSDQVGYILNLIDTPGHVDFSYEVSRALAAVEGAILLVDAAKGIQAQTIANLDLARKEGLVIIPVVNKIDLPNARIQETVSEIAALLGINTSEVIAVSAKNGDNAEQVLKAVIDKIPSPSEEVDLPLRALIFDSKYDKFQGVIAYIRVVEGGFKRGEKIHLMAGEIEGEAKDVGYLSPEPISADSLSAGEIGYVATGIKESGKVRVGDTIINAKCKTQNAKLPALPGYQEPKPVVFASFYPEDADDHDSLKDALGGLKLQDPSFIFEPESREALGRGFRCGFLGQLHLEIISERLRREFQIPLVISSPSVAYKIITKQEKEEWVYSASQWPEEQTIKEIQEPWTLLEIICPMVWMGKVMDFLSGFPGKHKDRKTLGDKMIVSYEMPLRYMMEDFYGRLKGTTQGYASMNYELFGWRRGNLIKLEILVAGQKEEAFSQIISKDEAFDRGKNIVSKLKKLLPAQQFSVALQAQAMGRIIARETIKAARKDVTAPLYGGDVTRKRKLLEKQKKGKKALKERGSVVIPSKVFVEMMKNV